MCKKYQFIPEELEKNLSELESKNWLKDFDENNFIDNVCKLEFTSPNKNDVFNAFKLFKPSETKILILGQDPYPSKNDNEGRAHGLAFSFGPNSKKKEADDSLLNIFKAIQKYNNSKKDIKYWNTN